MSVTSHQRPRIGSRIQGVSRGILGDHFDFSVDFGGNFRRIFGSFSVDYMASDVEHSFMHSLLRAVRMVVVSFRVAGFGLMSYSQLLQLGRAGRIPRLRSSSNLLSTSWSRCV